MKFGEMSLIKSQQILKIMAGFAESEVTINFADFAAYCDITIDGTECVFYVSAYSISGELCTLKIVEKQAFLNGVRFPLIESKAVTHKNIKASSFEDVVLTYISETTTNYVCAKEAQIERVRLWEAKQALNA